MGVRVSHYVIWGIRLPYISTQEEDGEDNEYVYSLFPEYEREKSIGKVCLISNEDESYLGYIVDAIGYEYGFSCGPLNNEKFKDSTEKRIAKILEDLGLPENTNYCWYVFTEYS